MDIPWKFHGKSTENRRGIVENRPRIETSEILLDDDQQKNADNVSGCDLGNKTKMI